MEKAVFALILKMVYFSDAGHESLGIVISNGARESLLILTLFILTWIWVYDYTVKAQV